MPRLVYLLVTMPENYNPNLPPPPQQPVVDPYGFITNPQVQQVRKAPLGVKDPFLQKLLVVVGGGAVLIIVIILVMNIFFGGKSNTQQLLEITQRQQEIVRVITANSAALNSQDLKNFAANAQASVRSDQTQLLAVVTKAGTKTDAKVLALKRDADTDTLLASAKSTNTLDASFKQILEAELTAYALAIQTAHKETSSKTTKALLAEQFQSAKLLLQQLQAE